MIGIRFCSDDITQDGCLNLERYCCASALNSLWPSDVTCPQGTWTSLDLLMACCIIKAKPLTELVLTYGQLDPNQKQI